MVESFARRFLRDDMGQDLIEYVLLLAFVALVTIVGLQSLGMATNSKYRVASTAINDAGSDPNGGGNPGNPTPGAGTPSQGNPGSGNPGQGGGAGNGNGNGGTGNGNGNGNGKKP
jgi:Flp pilus assembly pilin Flp